MSEIGRVEWQSQGTGCEIRLCWRKLLTSTESTPAVNGRGCPSLPRLKSGQDAVLACRSCATEKIRAGPAAPTDPQAEDVEWGWDRPAGRPAGSSRETRYEVEVFKIES